MNSLNTVNIVLTIQRIDKEFLVGGHEIHQDIIDHINKRGGRFITSSSSSKPLMKIELNIPMTQAYLKPIELSIFTMEKTAFTIVNAEDFMY